MVKKTMGRTKKVGITGRFGARYGSTIRKRVRRVEEKQKINHKCPSCASLKVKRESVSLWECKFCGHKFAGGAYIPDTPVGVSASRTANRLKVAK